MKYKPDDPIHADFATIASIVALGFVLRITLANGILHNGDGVMVGIMAWDIASGVNFPLWYYGGPYAGTFESWLTAGLFLFTGPTWWGVFLTPILFSTLGIIPFYRLGKSIGGRAVGFLSALLWAVAPWGMMFYNITPRGCYPETVAGGTLILWFVTERLKGRNFSAGAYFALGLMSGILLWSRLLVGPYLVVLAVFTLLIDKAKVINRKNIAGLAGIIIGGAPFFARITVVLGNGSAGELGFDNLAAKLKATLDIIAMLHMPTPQHYTLVVLAQITAYLMLTFLTFFIAVGIFQFLTSRFSLKKTIYLPTIVFTLIFLSIYTFNSIALLMQPRYIIPLQTSLIIASAASIGWIWNRTRVAGALFLVFILASNVIINRVVFKELLTFDKTSRHSIEDITNKLHKLNLPAVIVDDLHFSQRLFFESQIKGNDINTMRFGGNLDIQHTMAIEAEIKSGIMVGRNILPLVENWIQSCCGSEYKTAIAGTYAIVYDMKPQTWSAESIPSEQLRVHDQFKALVDRNHYTTYFTNKTTNIDFALGTVRFITKLRVLFGNRLPESIKALISEDGKEWASVGPANTSSPLYPSGPKIYVRLPWQRDREHDEYNFPPTKARYIRFQITHHGSIDYDIHEIFVYGATKKEKEKCLSIEEINKVIETSGVDFLFADRWTAAKLFHVKDKQYRLAQLAFIEADPKFTDPQLWDSRHWGALIPASDVKELETRLKIVGKTFSVKKLGQYSLFILKTDIRKIWWTGFTVIDR